MSFSREPQLDPSDIKLLRLFIKVVECGGFSGAQAELNVGASTVSTQMATLESRLGIRLCNRGRVGFSMTDKGRRVYAAAKRLEGAIDDLRSEIGELRGKLVGDLHIGVVDSTVTNCDFHLDGAIGRFCNRDNAVHITLHIMEPAMIEKSVLDGKLQIGIGAFYHHVPALAYEHLIRERHGLYCGARHAFFPLAPNGLSREDVLEAAYIARGYVAPRHLPPVAGLKVAATAYDMEAALTMIRSGAFIGHLPEHYAAGYVERGELRPILPAVFGFDSDFELVLRKGPGESRVVKAFVEDLRWAQGMPRSKGAELISHRVPAGSGVPSGRPSA